MTYGFIGTGNLVQTMFKGFAATGQGYDICIHDVDTQKMQTTAAAYGYTPCATAADVTRASVVVLAVKPNQLPGLLAEIGDAIRTNQPTLVSLPVGITAQAIETALGFPTPIIRAIPNVNAAVFASITALCANDKTDPAAAAAVEALFASIGTTVHLPEQHLDTFTAIASSAPAFLITFLETLAKAALKEGMPIHQAREIVAAMAAGTAKLLSAEDAHPQTVVDRIASPGGTTIAGLAGLTAAGFEASIYQGVAACVARMKN